MKYRLLHGTLALLLASGAAFAQSLPSSYTSATRYDLEGRVTGTISADPDAIGSGNPFLAVRNSYDAAGRLLKVESGRLTAWQSEAVAPANWGAAFAADRTAETQYDALNRKVREFVREGSSGPVRTMTEYSYDLAGRPTCAAVRMNPAAFAFSGIPNACVPNAAGAEGPDRITRSVFDAAGQRLQLRVGVGTPDEAAEATWAYNANGQVTTMIDGNGNRAELRYDSRGRQDRWTFPSTTRPSAYNDATQATALASAGAVNAADYEQYGYDANGNRTSLRKRDNAQHAYGDITYVYDALNRVTLKQVPERPAPHPYPLDPSHTRDVHYGYDLRGLQLYARFDSASGPGVTSAWDGFGRLASAASNVDGTARVLSYGYDRDGNRTRITHPDGASFGMNYDGLGRPDWLTDPIGSALANFVYDAGGAPAAAARPGATTGVQHDALGRRAALTHYLAAGLDVQWSYTHNPASGIASQTRSNDAYAWGGHYQVSRAYAANGLNQYSAAGGASFTYDANGNLVSDGARTYSYDVENRLVASGGVQLGYDPLGRLFQVTGGANTTRFLYDGDALVAEYNAAGTLTARYAHGAGADVPLVSYAGTGTAAADRRNLLVDHQGSIVAISDNAGTRLAINAYDEYGIPAAGNTGRFQYTGQAWLAELGMYHYKARVYSPTLGRFLQTDPVGYEDQVNLYAYVRNDPVNHTDPDGLTCRHDRRSGDYRCRVDNVDRSKLNSTQRNQLGRFEREYSRVVNRLMSLPNERIRVAPSGRGYNNAPLGAFTITRREAATNLIARTFSYRPGDTTGNAGDRAYTRGTAGPLGTGHVVSHIKDLGLQIGSPLTIVHEGALHGSRQEYRGGLVLPDGRGLGSEPYRTAHGPPYRDASCALLDECP